MYDKGRIGGWNGIGLEALRAVRWYRRRVEVVRSGEMGCLGGIKDEIGA